MRQQRPQRVVEQMQIGIEVAVGVVVSVGRWRNATDESVALGTDPHAGGVEHQRHSGTVKRRADHEHRAFPRLDRQRDAGERGNPA